MAESHRIVASGDRKVGVEVDPDQQAVHNLSGRMRLGDGGVGDQAGGLAVVSGQPTARLRHGQSIAPATQGASQISTGWNSMRGI